MKIGFITSVVIDGEEGEDWLVFVDQLPFVNFAPERRVSYDPTDITLDEFKREFNLK